MDVAVCIVSWNTVNLLRRCLASVYKETRDVSFELIVVDNNSTDGSAEMVLREFPAAKLIALDNNLGFAKGCNIAAQSSNAKYILYLNPDTELISNALFEMFIYMENSAGIGALGCKLLNTDGSIQYTCAATFPNFFNELSSLLFLNRLFPSARWLSARELDFWDHEDSRQIDCLSGACIFLPRMLNDALGGFDESLFMYGEDIDLCFRIRSRGLLLWYMADVSIYHHEGASSSKRGRSFAPVLQRRGNFEIIKKNIGVKEAFLYRGAVTLGVLSRLLLGLFGAPVLVVFMKDGRVGLIDFFKRHFDLLRWSIGLGVS